MGFPVALVAWTAAGLLAGHRAFVRPARAVVAVGSIARCPGGPGCASGLTVDSAAGVAEVYALVRGTIVRAAAGRIELASAVEPVIVVYEGAFLPTVHVGQAVAPGEVLTRAGSITLSVTQYERLGDGSLRAFWLEPTSWLAARGLRPATKLTGGTGWCLGGRTLAVPQDVARCGLRLPAPAAFALLPVNVQLT